MKPIALLFAILATATAQEFTAIPRSFPAIGDKLTQPDRESLAAELERVTGLFNALPKKKENANAEIFIKAVKYALEFTEFYGDDDVKKAKALLVEAESRIESLKKGEAPWMTAKGLVVRGYYSDIDGSAQPFALEIPDHAPTTNAPAWIWLQGRGEKRTDLHFIAERMTKPGQFHPAGTIIIHTWGRYCVGTKNAGEQDVLDVRALLIKEKRIDPKRLALAGFSMGGAGAWMLGAHYTDHWSVVHAGAGFVEVRKFQKLKDEFVEALPVWEKTLWGQNDVPDYARNLLNVPVIAYSGEIDKQREAAEIMTEVLAKEGLTLKHFIGPKTEHKYEPVVQKEVEAEIQKALLNPPSGDYPLKVTFQTKTLDYSEMYWVKVLGLEEHWKDSRVDANLDAPISKAKRAEITTKNVTALRLESPTGENFSGDLVISIDGQEVKGGGSGKAVLLTKADGKWSVGRKEKTGLRKVPGLQGPIDDAFTTPFLYVMPDKTGSNPAVNQWVESESAYQKARWKYLMRGDLRIKKASEVTEEDSQKYNLILWGDASSNSLIAKILPKLPIQWTSETITVGAQNFPATGHALSMIYPNSEHPGKYVVFNSGLTFRENDKSNALQNPRLPDWAVVDLSVAPDGNAPGKIPAAGFFDESWKLK